jgi:hypothetical protein
MLTDAQGEAGNLVFGRGLGLRHDNLSRAVLCGHRGSVLLDADSTRAGGRGTSQHGAAISLAALLAREIQRLWRQLAERHPMVPAAEDHRGGSSVPRHP